MHACWIKVLISLKKIQKQEKTQNFYTIVYGYVLN